MNIFHFNILANKKRLYLCIGSYHTNPVIVHAIAV